MKHSITDSVIGFGILVVSIIVPVYLVSTPVPQHPQAACFATSCSTTPEKEQLSKQPVIAQIDIRSPVISPTLSPTPVFVAETNVQPENTQSLSPQIDQQPSPTVTPIPQSPSPTPQSSPSEPNGDTPHDQHSVIQNTLQPVQTVISQATSLLH